VKYKKEEATEDIELSLLLTLLEKSLSEMTAEELREFADSMGTELTIPTAPLILMAVWTAVRASGFAAYRLSVVMLSTLAKVVLAHAPHRDLSDPDPLYQCTGWAGWYRPEHGLADCRYGRPGTAGYGSGLPTGRLSSSAISIQINVINGNPSLCQRKKNSTIAWHHGWR